VVSAAIAGHLKDRYGDLGDREAQGPPESVGGVVLAPGGDETETAAATEPVGFAQLESRFWQQAIAVARGRHDYATVVDLCRQQLKHLEELPPEDAGQEQTLLCLNALLYALPRAHGWGHPGLQTTAARAVLMARELNDAKAWQRLLVMQTEVRLACSEYEQALALGRELLQQATRHEQSADEVQAHWLLGMPLTLSGDWAAGRSRLEKALEAGTPGPDTAPAQSALKPFDSAIRAQLAQNLWCLGFPAQARARLQQALVGLNRLQDRERLQLALSRIGFVYSCLGEQGSAGEVAAKALHLAQTQRQTYWLAWAKVQLGYALGRQSRANEGLALIEEGIAALGHSGATMQRDRALMMMAEICLAADRPQQGLEAVEEGLSLHGGNIGPFDAVLFRLKAELLQSLPGRQPQAEASLRKALEIAGFQTARSFELTAAVSWFVLQHRQGCGELGTDTLRQSYEWFTEGFDTPDLMRAGALLADDEKEAGI